MYDVIIIGAGTAGMSAAIYARRAGKTVFMLEAAMYGGQIINAAEIENYPGIPKIAGYQFAMDLYGQVKELGVEFASKMVTGIEVCDNYQQVLTKDMNYEGRTVILATGARNRRLGMAAETRLTGHGISYCATCDGAFYRDKAVAVYGGGNTALGDAEYLANLCKEVYLIHRRQELRGSVGLAERLRQKENITFLLDTVIIDIQGETSLEAVELQNVVTKERSTLPVDGLFVAIGQEPVNSIFAECVELDEYGYIQAGEDCKTNVAGIYAAGDCRTKAVRQLTTAAADGAIAALAAVDYINSRFA
jgi:thioredoxin reductase (NADPH)